MQHIPIETKEQYKKIAESIELLRGAELGTKEATQYKMYVLVIREYIKQKVKTKKLINS